MRLRFAPASGLVAAVLAVPALAADHTVTARTTESGRFVFEPAQVTVAVGDTVTFDNARGVHDLMFEDRDVPTADPGTGWSVQRTFAAADAGTVFRFRCTLHSQDYETGMIGTVTVTSAPPATPTPTPAPTSSPTPGQPSTPTAPGEPTTPAPTGAASAPATPAPEAQAGPGAETGARAGTSSRLTARVLNSPACVVAGRRCRQRGVRLRVATNAAVAVRGVLYRRAARGDRERRFGTLRLAAAQGRREVTVTRTREGRRLALGRYRLVLTAPGAPSATVRFAVVRR